MKHYTEDLLKYLDASPTAFHATAEAAKRLIDAGYTVLDERDRWDLKQGGKYLVQRQGSSLIGFRIGANNAAEHGVRIAAAHTDSPGFRIKVDSESRKAGGVRVTAEVYGGPIRNTWLDRELAIAGRILVSTGTGRKAVLFDSEEAWALIPNLAIHLNREVNKGTELNAQTEMRAILSVSCGDENTTGYLRQIVGKKLGISVDDIGEYDLFLYPLAKAGFIGEAKDMFASGRIDNLGMSHAVVTALIESTGKDTVFAALFDSEEIGSMTWQGANSSFLPDIVRRAITPGQKDDEEYYRTLAASFLVSGDAAHAVHPNYSDKHDESFMPELNKGPVVKIHAGQRYTTTSDSSSAFLDLCGRKGIPVQKFIGRSDIPSGGTIGPIASSRLGIPSIDVGNPIWAMHSSRETGGSEDQGYMIEALRAFYQIGFCRE